MRENWVQINVFHASSVPWHWLMFFFPIIYIICRPLALGIGECFQPSFVGMAIFPLRGDAHAEVLSACAKAQEWAAAFQVLQMEDAPWFSTRG